MNSQIDKMILVVEGSRGPPVRQRKVVLSCQAIIKFIKQAAIIRGTKMKTISESKFWMVFTPPPHYNETDRAPPREK